MACKSERAGIKLPVNGEPLGKRKKTGDRASGTRQRADEVIE
jgi:hypothetical protein